MAARRPAQTTSPRRLPRRRVRGHALFALAAAMCLLALPALWRLCGEAVHAQAVSGLQPVPAIERVHIGFDDRFLHGAWTPIRVELRGGSRPFRGELALDIPRTSLLSVEATYVQLHLPVEVDTGATVFVRTTVPLQGSPHPMRAVLRASDGREVAALTLSLKERSMEMPLALLVDPGERSWSWLSAGSSNGSGRTETVLAYARAAEELPDSALAFASLSAIIFHNSFSLNTLTPRQVEAILEYVRLGGRLVLVGGTRPPALPAAWRRALPSGLQDTIRHLEGEDGSLVPAWSIDPGADDRWQVSAALDDVPLIVSAPFGAGDVTLLAVNPSDPAARALLAPPVWWEKTLAAPPRYSPGRSPLGDEDIWQLLDSAETEVRMPPFLKWTLIAYTAAVILAGLAASRHSRLWLALPAMGVAASIVVGVFLSRPGMTEGIVYAEAQIGLGVTEGVIDNRTYGVLATNAPKAPPVELKGEGASPFPASYGADANLLSRQVDRGIRLDALVPGRPVRFVHEALQDLEVIGRFDPSPPGAIAISNRSGLTLRHAHVVERNRFISIGSLAPGAEYVALRPDWYATGTSWIALSVQSGLERLPAPERPPAFEAKLLVLAIGRALDDAFLSGRRNQPHLIALVEPAELISLEPPGRTLRARAIVVPLVPFGAEGPEGGEGDAS